MRAIQSLALRTRTILIYIARKSHSNSNAVDLNDAREHRYKLPHLNLNRVSGRKEASESLKTITTLLGQSDKSSMICFTYVVRAWSSRVFFFSDIISPHFFNRHPVVVQNLGTLEISHILILTFVHSYTIQLLLERRTSRFSKTDD